MGRGDEGIRVCPVDQIGKEVGIRFRTEPAEGSQSRELGFSHLGAPTVEDKLPWPMRGVIGFHGYTRSWM
jgi:hypothetical protein